MFLPLVTNRRLPTTFAPVVSPTSCLIEPRYSTLSDDAQSGPDLFAEASGAATSARLATSAVAIDARTYPTARGNVAMLLCSVRRSPQRTGGGCPSVLAPSAGSQSHTTHAWRNAACRKSSTV